MARLNYPDHGNRAADNRVAVGAAGQVHSPHAIALLLTEWVTPPVASDVRCPFCR